MRERFEAAGLLTPHFTTADIDENPQAIAGRVRYPCVLKPLDLSGSQGVIKVDHAGAFPSAFARVAAIVAACRHNGTRPAVLVEDFIPGEEVAVEALLRTGVLEVLAIFDKPDPLNGPFFEETIYVTPSRLAAEQQTAIHQTVARAAPALGLTDGPIHAELRLNEGGIWMLEVAARSIGGLCSRTLRFGSGISLEELILRHALRMPLDRPRLAAGAAGVLMLPVPENGTLWRVSGVSDAMAIPGVTSVELTIPLGQAVESLPEGDRYLGFVIARGPDAQFVEDALRRAQGLIGVEVNA